MVVGDWQRCGAMTVSSWMPSAAADKLATVLPDGTSVPLRVGDTLELNDHRAVVVGLCQVSRTFQSQPVVYTTYARATRFAPRERKLLSFVLVKAKAGVDVASVAPEDSPGDRVWAPIA